MALENLVGHLDALAEGRQCAVTGRVATETISENRDTYNVLAETASGNGDNVVMVGAHLDRVVAGPGVDDNGPGSAAILTVAEGLQKVETTSKVRFAWWGAEQLGLLGAEHHVDELVQTGGPDKVGPYLNFDMIGSANFGRSCLGRDGVQWTKRLRTVHRRGDSVRPAVHRSGRHQDRRAGGALRRSCRRSLRRLLPHRVRR